ncbi:MAG: hypothetical protein EPN21_06435 [Methylococcaceae bacterium]|nr:MAG: hypothetical protein EPN21_06435 [Methylococcaceae bacterium]
MDQYTEVTGQSWLGRLGSAFKGVIFGLLLFLAAFPLLFWNEGRAVHTAKSLEEGAAAVISLPSAAVDPAHEGKLVHATGLATTSETLTDPQFGVAAQALKLNRKVEMYQWQESSSSKTEKKLGGETETVTTYSYDKVWSEDKLDSSGYKKAHEHQNPAQKAYPSAEWVARQVSFGDFALSRSLVDRIADQEALLINDEKLLPKALRGRVHRYEGGFYAGKDANAPEIGDLRITFTEVKPTQVSVVAQQAGKTFQPYATQNGETIELLQTGVHGSVEMFQQAQDENALLTWILRGAGLLLMFIGLSMMLGPLSVIADVIPLLGDIAEMGVGLVAFLLAVPFALTTVGAAWLFYRPWLGVTLLAIAGAVLWTLRTRLHKTVPVAV